LLVVALDLQSREAVAQRGLAGRGCSRTPDRPVAEVTASVLVEARRAAGPVQINAVPQEIPWSVLLGVPDVQQRNGRVRAGHER
jgi:hypothetical protein